ASSPSAVRLASEYAQAWRDSEQVAHRPDPQQFFSAAGAGPGARLALLRADMTLRWESGQKVDAQWYLDRYPDLGQDTLVALSYAEFCLRDADQQRPDPTRHLTRYPEGAGPLGRVLEIQELVGSDPTTLTVLPFQTDVSFSIAPGAGGPFPETGATISDFLLVEELGRGSFARV